MDGRRDKSFFLPLLLSGALLALLTVAACVAPLLECEGCGGRGFPFWSKGIDGECFGCEGRGRITLLKYWDRR